MTSQVPNPNMFMSSSPAAGAQAVGFEYPPAVAIKEEPIDFGYNMAAALTSQAPATSAHDMKPLIEFGARMQLPTSYIPTPNPTPLLSTIPTPFMHQPAHALPPVTSSTGASPPQTIQPVKGRRGRKPQVTAYVSKEKSNSFIIFLYGAMKQTFRHQTSPGSS